MIEVKAEEEKKVRCLLVAPPPREQGADGYPHELENLVHSLDMEVADAVLLVRREPTPAYGLGKGKALEIADRAKGLMADCIIFDWDIDPTKQRNWEKLVNLPVFDRNEVIIRIFAQRAQTKEAVLQVELAQLTYSLPRLSHSYGALSRQRGGAFGNKGSGETQLELDRRRIEDKIIQIKKELSQVQMTRRTQHRQRERSATPSCALVGYTNAGKSSLLNALTGAEVFVEDKLFATLDPTTRKLNLAEGATVLLTDTVGFISHLPHTLIEAFKSTLEESAHADLLLLTVDASDTDCKSQYEQVLHVLDEIGATDLPRLILLNKIDRVQGDMLRLSELRAAFPDALALSAKTGQGFEELFQQLTKSLFGELRSYRIPLAESALVESVRKNGTILSEDWQEDCVKLSARIPEGRTLALLAQYALAREEETYVR